MYSSDYPTIILLHVGLTSAETAESNEFQLAATWNANWHRDAQ